MPVLRSEDGRGRRMSRYIDADTVFNELTRRYKTANGEARKAYREALDIVTAAEDIEVRHGRWEGGKCSVCGEHALFWLMSSGYYASPYCPNCGSCMDLEGDTE